jgi:L-serine dehydratase
VAGLLGFNIDDDRIIVALNIAQQKGMKVRFRLVDLGDEYHPNTAKIMVKGVKTPAIEVVGCSIGGGNVLITEINGFKTNITGDYETIITLHEDKPGVVSKVTGVLSEYHVNVAFMYVSRKARGKKAFMAIEVDYKVQQEVLEDIASFKEIQMVRLIQAFSSIGGV